MILAMPNTNPPTVDEAAFALTHKLARSGARCDYGVFVGASSDNYSTLPQIGEKAAALKMYLNETFTTLKLDDISVWMKVKSIKTFHFLTLKAPTKQTIKFLSAKFQKLFCPSCNIIRGTLEMTFDRLYMHYFVSISVCLSSFSPSEIFCTQIFQCLRLD